MVKNICLMLIFIITGIILFLAGMMVQKSLDGSKFNNRLHQKPDIIANQFLDRLQKA
jgi:hypothetical protein